MHPLHDAKDLLHGGGPAGVLGIAVAGGGGHPGPADGADEVPISTIEDLERWFHLIHAHNALGYQVGRSRNRCRTSQSWSTPGRRGSWSSISKPALQFIF